MKITYSHLQSYFSEPLPSVEDVCTLFTFGAFEIEGVDSVERGGKTEYVLDLKVLPNRAHDCLSWVGIAREYATLSGKKMKIDPFTALLPSFGDASKNVGRGTQLRLEVAHPELHPSHTLSYIRGARVGPSPDWLRDALEIVGQRSINNVVDATNYVMLEYGQPTHAFDAQKFSVREVDGTSVRGVRIRPARDGEKIIILGGKELSLTPQVQVLSDAISGDVLDIAGVKGGTHAELIDTTTDLIITSGKYNAANIRKTTQAVGIRTDASKRFENEIPHLLPWYGQQRVQELILEVAGGEVVETVAIDNIPGAGDAHSVTVACERIRSTLGSSVTNETIRESLVRGGLAVTAENDMLTVTPPWWRLDILIPEDVVEEVGRTVGYDTVPATPLPHGRVRTEDTQLFLAIDRMRHVLREAGFYELSTYSLRDHGDVQLANALAADKGFLRANLSEGISAALAQNEYNAPAVGVYDCIKLFEIGHVFTVHEGVRSEKTHVCIGVRYLSGKKREEKARILLEEMQKKSGEGLGVEFTGTLTAETCEFDLESVVAGKTFSPTELPTVSNTRYAPLSHFPVALRDVAVWTPLGGGDQFTEAYTRESMRAVLDSLCTRIDLFDTFTKDGRTSYAFHLVFQSFEKTLTDDDLTPHMDRVYTTLRSHGYEIR